MHKTFMHKKGAKRIALSCAALLALSSGGTVLAAEATAVPISAALGTGLSYEFTGADAGKAGYAEGTISLSSATDAAYHLYWSNNTGALSGYYPIATLEVGAGKTETFFFWLPHGNSGRRDKGDRSKYICDRLSVRGSSGGSF